MSASSPEQNQKLGLDFLQRKYTLNRDPLVASSANRHNLRIKRDGGEVIAEHDYSGRIQGYFDHLNDLISHPERGERNLRFLKDRLYTQIIIKPEEIPDSYWQSIIQKHRDEGRPIEKIPERTKQNLSDTLITDQRESLDIWINYLASSDCKWPDWFRYYTLRSVLVMGRYDKGKKKFAERSKTGKSISPFPELIRDAADFVYDALTKKQEGKFGNFGNLKYGYGIKSEEKIEFERLLKQGDPNFSKLYAWAIDHITPISEEQLLETRGQWIKYSQGSNPKKVTDALAQYGTGWCIRGEATTRLYLTDSDLEIYFSLDKDDKPVVPRIVIVTRDGRIDEVRGIAKEEHWDHYITNVVEQKLASLPDGEKFKKRVVDMQKMTALYRKCFAVDKKNGVKTYLNSVLDKEELKFLYEFESEIEGFGYGKDPRIQEIRQKRNIKADLSQIRLK